MEMRGVWSHMAALLKPRPINQTDLTKQEKKKESRDEDEGPDTLVSFFFYHPNYKILFLFCYNFFFSFSFQVWFQNRRTKWRKKHAAEMATAKRKQDEQHADMNDDLSGDEEDLGRSTAANRLRRELAEQEELARQ